MATPATKPPLAPVKRVLLQQERLQTFDKTWLPARLNPPALRTDQSYAAYLVEYEQYLAALQNMRALHLGLTRKDPRRRVVAPRVPNPPEGPSLSMAGVAKMSKSGVLPTAATAAEKYADFLRGPSVSQWRADHFSMVPQLIFTVPSEVQDALPTPPTERQLSDRKVQRAARRRARRAVRKERKATEREAAATKASLAKAVKAEAEFKLVTYTRRTAAKQSAPTSSPGAPQAAPKKPLGPSALRRLERRRLARLPVRSPSGDARQRVKEFLASARSTLAPLPDVEA